MAETEETIEETQGSRSAMHIHEAMVEWLGTEEGGEYDVDNMTPAETIAAAFAKRVAWRKTEAYENAKSEHAEQREAEKAERQAAREEAKAALEAERAAKAEAKAKAAEEKKAAAEKAEGAAKKAPAKKAPAKKQAGRRSARSKASDGDDPFED